MKIRELRDTVPVPAKNMGTVLTVQRTENLLVLNYYRDRILKGRYGMNVQTGEYGHEKYEQGKSAVWRQANLANMLGAASYDGYWHVRKNVMIDTKEQARLLEEVLPMSSRNRYEDVYGVLARKEHDYNSERKWKTENRRWARVKAVMEKVPELPPDFVEWARAAAGLPEYIFRDKITGVWRCACGKVHSEQALKKHNATKKLTERSRIHCPDTGSEVEIIKRTTKKEKCLSAMILQDIDESMAVVRHFRGKFWQNGTDRYISLREEVRYILHRHHPKGLKCGIYYEQYGVFDNKSNPKNRHTYEAVLYPGGIEEALAGTAYKDWARVFSFAAAAGLKAHFNKIMIPENTKEMSHTAEYLLKGRFYTLFRDMAKDVSIWAQEYSGPLDINGTTLNEVFGIRDTQKINRIREKDGGTTMLKWMQWSDETGKKVDDETLDWLMREELIPKDMPKVPMSPRQVMNYICRQQTEGYPKKAAGDVLETWEDYLSMCENAKKDLTDEMVYRPRDLKRRHEQMVEEARKRRMLEQMAQQQDYCREKGEEMRKKFPGAEEILQEIRPKYEYANEQYTILVPQHLTDILLEGQALHHCCGSSDRYFDRIRDRETYICFLRRTNEPHIHYYTIEVEPSGTIRQHRSYFDEEPGIEEIRGFLKEWQQVIKKRLTREDRRYAERSVTLREKNIKELKEKRNTRVLQALKEDFMEAVI